MELIPDRRHLTAPTYYGVCSMNSEFTFKMLQLFHHVLNLTRSVRLLYVRNANDLLRIFWSVVWLGVNILNG